MLFAAVAAVTITPFLASPAFAKTSSITTTNTGCSLTGTTPGAEIGMYPANDGSESGFIAACTFEYDSSQQEVSGNFHIEDFQNVVWHNGAGRTLQHATGGGTTVAITHGTNGTVAYTPCPAGLTAANTVGHTLATGQQPGSGAKSGTYITAFSAGATCTITINQNWNPSVTLDFTLDNGYAHTTLATSPGGATTSSGSCTVTSGGGLALSGDAGLSISGTFIPKYSTVASVSGGNWIINVPGDAPCNTVITHATADQQITIGGTTQNSNNRVVSDSAVTCTAPNTLHSTVAHFKTGAGDTGDIGLQIIAPCITGGVGIITAIPSNNNVTVSSGVSNQASAQTTIVVGEPSITAPLTGDVVINQGVELDLAPALVAGSDSCTYEHAEGFGIEGKWVNPNHAGGTASDFDTPSTFLVAQPTNTVAIAELQFTTSVVTYAGYVLQYYATGAGQKDTAPHFTMDFPGTPTTAALCGPGAGDIGGLPSTSVTFTLTPSSPGLGFAISTPAVSVSQSAIGSSIGKPSSAELRATNLSTTFDGGVAAGQSRSYVVDDSGSPTTPWNTGALAGFFFRDCIQPGGTTPSPLVNFHCGQ